MATIGKSSLRSLKTEQIYISGLHGGKYKDYCILRLVDAYQ
jgi:hypothetical protein